MLVIQNIIEEKLSLVREYPSKENVSYLLFLVNTHDRILSSLPKFFEQYSYTPDPLIQALADSLVEAFFEKCGGVLRIDILKLLDDISLHPSVTIAHKGWN